MKETAECPLVLVAFVNVRDPQFWLPQKSVVGAFEYLPLLGDRADNRLERGAFVDVAKCACFDLLDNLRYSPPNGPKIFKPLLPQEPCAIGGIRIVSPTFDQDAQQIRQENAPSKGFVVLHPTNYNANRVLDAINLSKPRKQRQRSPGFPIVAVTISG